MLQNNLIQSSSKNTFSQQNPPEYNLFEYDEKFTGELTTKFFSYNSI